MAKRKRPASGAAAPGSDSGPTTAAPPSPNGPTQVAGPHARGRVNVYDSRNAPALPITAAALTTREHEYLWENYVPRDQVTLFTGEASAGKSTVLAALAAAVSAGRAMYGRGGFAPGTVLLYCAEEDAGATVRPRLEAAHADLGRVHLGDFTAGGVQLPRMMLPNDFGRLDRLIAELRVSLCVIDPITSYLSGTVDVNRDQSVREVLEGLQAIGRERGCTIPIVKHYRKSRDGDPTAWVGGAPSWTQVPRVALAFGFDPDDRTKRIMSVLKHSLKAGVRSMRFEIGERDGAPHWIGGALCDITAEDMGSGVMTPGDRDALGDAEAFLRDQLAEQERHAKDIVRLSAEVGISLGTLRRAKAKLGVVSTPIGPNAQRQWMWRLPEQKPPA